MQKKKKLKEVDIYINNKDLIDKFITFYNNLKIKERSNFGKLSIENHLSDFFLDINNKFGIDYKNIYKKFAKEQNRKLENLLDNKIERGIFDINCKNKIKIQQINEKEIFTLSFPKQYTFTDILFDSSYRKIIDSEARSNELYKEYEINYDLIEEKMTELLLKNKKLLDDKISEFIYNNEVFANQVTNLITLFQKRYNTKNIGIFDKVAIYKFYEDNKNNSPLCKNMINDFIELIKHLNDKRKENAKINDINIKEETKIYEVVEKLNDTFSNNFIKIFEKNDGLTIDKTVEIFLYYLKLNFDLIKEELKNYQNELNDKSKELINNYYQKEHLISKKDFTCAIRLFISLVLFLEEDKENKIKSNSNNLINYLKASDFWSNDIYENDDFNKNLNELKSINVPISQILYLYENLGRDIESNFNKDIIEQIEKEIPPNPPEEKSDNSGGIDDDEEEKEEEDMFAVDDSDEDEGRP